MSACRLNRKKWRLWVGVIGVGLLLGLPQPLSHRSPAKAASPEVGQLGPEEAAYVADQAANASGTLTAAAVRPSPSGCLQKAHNPHKSTHFAARMNGEIRAKCRNLIPDMFHTGQMWETRFWGWDRIGDPGKFHDQWVEKGSAFANDKCRDNLVRVTGEGHIVDVDGQRYLAATESRHIDNPCGL